jgi:hypothetical protein
LAARRRDAAPELVPAEPAHRELAQVDESVTHQISDHRRPTSIRQQGFSVVGPLGDQERDSIR